MSVRSLVVVFLVTLASAWCPSARSDEPRDFLDRSIAALIQSVCSDDEPIALAAALTLGAHDSDAVDGPALAALAASDDRAARARLGYVLARRGRREGYEALLTSIEPEAYWAWRLFAEVAYPVARFSDPDWIASAREWVDEQSGQELEHATSPGRFFLNHFGPHEADWRLYLLGVGLVQDIGDRERARDVFRAVERVFPGSMHAKTASEHAAVLDVMIAEDAAWTEPQDPAALPIQARLEYLVFHLRDINHYQFIQPGSCGVLGPYGRFGEEPIQNPADVLMEMGDEALPTVVGLLTDRRMTQSVGYWRDFHASRKIMRYQDVAIAILGRVLPFRPYTRRATGSDFSIESTADQEMVQARILAWLDEARAKTPLERRWLAIEYAGILDALQILATLALEHEQKDAVLTRLNRFYDGERSAWYRPQVATLMVKLGDLSKVREVIETFADREPTAADLVGGGAPEGGAAALNARDVAKRLKLLYGARLDELPSGDEDD